MDLFIEKLTPLLQFGNVLAEQPDHLHFLANLELQCMEVEPVSMQGDRPARRLLQRLDKFVNKGTTMWVIAGGVVGDEARQSISARLEHTMGIEEVGQDCQRQARRRVGQNRLEFGAGPANQIEDSTARRADELLVTVTLLGQALECVVLRRRDMHGIQRSAAEARERAQHVSVGQISLRVLAQILAKGLDPLSFDANDTNPRSLQPLGDRKPRHPRRLHDGDNRNAGWNIAHDSINELLQVIGRQPKS